MSEGKFEPKDDTGNLWRVEERKSEKHPEYEGEFKLRCPHCAKAQLGWVKGWVREAKNGKKFFSLAFKHRQSGGGQ
jgi:hypothetical protein